MALQVSEDETDRRAAELYLSAMHEEWDRRRDNVPARDLAKNWPANVEARRYGREEPTSKSPLAVHGYHVGRHHGEQTELRQAILARCYRQPLMPAFAADELKPWGEPATGRRLQKIASFISAQIRDKSDKPDMEDAVSDWRNDLDYMQRTFYAPNSEKMPFAWPVLAD